jgi:hypothetical protein
MIVYLFDPKNSTRELIKLINNFSKVAGYNINSNKSVAFLYSKNKQAKKENRETIPFIIVTSNIKYLGVTLTKKVKDLYDKNFKTLKKEIEEDLRRWKDLPCSWIGRTNIVKMLLYKALVQVDHGLPHKIRYPETNRKKSGEGPQVHGYREIFPEQNTNSLCSKSKNWQMGPHKIAKLLKAKGSVNRANGNHHIRKKIFTNSTSDRGLISNIYEELKKLDSSWAWWCMPLFPALRRQRQVDFWVRGQPGLQSEFQDSQGYTDKPCLEKTKQNKNKKQNKTKQQQQNKPNQTNKKKLDSRELNNPIKIAVQS